MPDPVHSGMALEALSPELRDRFAALERVLARENDHESLAAMLAHAAECASEGLCIFSEEGIIRYANRSFAEMHGCGHDTVCGRSVTEFLLPQSLTWDECFERAKEQGAMTQETRHAKSDGDSFTAISRLFYVEGGPRTGAFLILRIREAPEGKALSETLAGQDESYRYLVETAPDSIIFLDLSGKIILTNAITAEQLGYSSVDELCQACPTVLDLIAPHDRERALREISACIAQGNKFAIEYDVLTKDGCILPVETSTNVVLDQNGCSIGMVGIARDISRRREAETHLQLHLRMEQLLTSIATRFIGVKPEQVGEAIQNAIAQIGEAIEVDRIGIALFSTDEKQVQHRFDWGASGPAPPLADRLQQSIETFPWLLQQLRRHACIRFSNNGELPVDAGNEGGVLGSGPQCSFLMAPMISHGDLAGYVVFEVMRGDHQWDDAVSTLILILAEIFAGAISRQRADKALRESEERFRQLVGSSHAMFWLAAADFSRALYISPAFAEIWGIPMDQLQADPLCFLAAVHPDDRERVAKTLTDEFHAGTVEFRVIRSDGATRWLMHRGFPVLNSRGETFRFAGFAEDITARKGLEKEILEISSREQRRIGRDLHDGLGQHLAGILCMSRGLAQTLAEKGITEAGEAAEIADLIKEAIAHTRTLARGACPVDLEAEGLAHALDKLAERTEQVTGIECLFESDPCVLVTSPDQAEHLYRIAQEAVTNAVKHAEATLIRIMLVETGVGKMLQIEDNGKGLPQILPTEGGMGLRLMEHRARLADATFVVKRRFGGGTEVSCLFRAATTKQNPDEGVAR